MSHRVLLLLLLFMGVSTACVCGDEWEDAPVVCLHITDATGEPITPDSARIQYEDEPEVSIDPAVLEACAAGSCCVHRPEGPGDYLVSVTFLGTTLAQTAHVPRHSGTCEADTRALEFTFPGARN